MSIIDLQETSPDNWRAKYQGNYGIYTIKMTTNGRNYSCSCPSDYYPCKHIPMIREAINKRIAKAAKSVTQHKEVNIEEVLKEVSANELRAFIGRLAKYNSELSNSILLEFSQKIKVDSGNKYSAILRTALEKEVFDYDDWYEYESGIEIEALDLWLERARRYADDANYLDTVLICKACIEEYAEWLLKQDVDIMDYIDESYLDSPFEILTNILSKTDIYTKDLFEYCKSEMLKEKYSQIGMEDYFNDLLSQLTPSENSAEFIALQNKLFCELPNKNSFEAQRILQRKIDFYDKIGQEENAWKVICDNLQIEKFREIVVKENIKEGKFAEAKQLIDEFLSKNGSSYHFDRKWNMLKLEIAQKEKDTPIIREISFSFIKDRFSSEYYNIYKSTFEQSEWPAKLESLISHYQKQSRWFSSNAADVFVITEQKERLMNYIENYLSLENLEKYYAHFSDTKKTLTMFRKAIDHYMDKNTGRDCYERVVGLFKLMKVLEGGEQIVAEMISQYRMQYKNRRAMLEIFDRFG